MVSEKIVIYCKWGHKVGVVDYKKYVKNYRHFSYFCEKCYINKKYGNEKNIGGEKENMVDINWKKTQKELGLTDGVYTAVCRSVELIPAKSSKFGRDYLRWSFGVDGVDFELVGSTSLNFSNVSKAGRWAMAIVGYKPNSTEQLIGKKCKVLLSFVKGREENEILVVKDVLPYKPETKKKK